MDLLWGAGRAQEMRTYRQSIDFDFQVGSEHVWLTFRLATGKRVLHLSRHLRRWHG
jgi:hypothetical protein